MDINKKIKKLLSLNDKSIKHYSKFVKKNFGSINYQNNGDSLLHLIVMNGSDFGEIEVISCIKRLIELGIDPNVKDDYGQTFLQNSLDMSDLSFDFVISVLSERTFFAQRIDVNSKDNDGNTLVHSAIHTYINWNHDKKIIDLTKLLIDKYNFDIFNKNKMNEDIFICFKDELNTSKYFANYKGEMDIANSVLNDLVIAGYSRNTDELVKLILDSNKTDLVQYLNSRFNDTSISFFICQADRPENDEVIERTLLCIKKLLSVGCKPNLLIDNKNFIADAILKGYPVSYISKICELANPFGLDVNSSTSILFLMVENKMPYSDILNAYIVLSKYGYDNLSDDYSRATWDHTYDYWDIRLEGFKIMLNNALKQIGFSDEVVFSNGGIRITVDTIIEFSGILELGNDYQFIQNFCNFINEKYSMNIVFNETICDKWLLENLKEYLVHSFENYVSKKITLVKESKTHE